MKQNLAYPTEQERSRLEQSCAESIAGRTIGAMMKMGGMEPVVLLHTEVKFCAATYCAAPNTEREVIEESTRFIASKFGHLNVNEIREAFRLAAAGQIDASLNAYYGMFSVNILGKVLSAYDDHRTQTYREVRARINAEQQQRENEQRAERLKEQFGTIAEQFQALTERNEKHPTWNTIPGWFAEKVVRDDLAGFCNDEKGKMWVTAKAWAVNSVGSWILNPATPDEDRKRYKAAKSEIEKNREVFPEALKSEAQDTYAKMLVFSKIAEYTQP